MLPVEYKLSTASWTVLEYFQQNAILQTPEFWLNDGTKINSYFLALE